MNSEVRSENAESPKGHPPSAFRHLPSNLSANVKPSTINPAPHAPRPAPSAVTADTWMPFGKYGPKKNDPRRLRDIPAAYLRWLGQQEILYYHPALAEFLDQKFYPGSATVPVAPGGVPPSGSPPRRRPPSKFPAAKNGPGASLLRDFLKTLE